MPPYTPGTVLYIEDNVPNFLLIEQVLAKRPEIGVLPATTGLKGAGARSTAPTGFGSARCSFAGPSGREVLEQLRADWRTNEVPVIVISADATAARRERLLAAGAHDYLTKPLDIRSFLEIVDDVLRKTGSAAHG